MQRDSCFLIEQEVISGLKDDNYETRKKHGSLDITKPLEFSTEVFT